MELSVVHKEEKNHSETDKLVDKPQTDATHVPSAARATSRRFDPDARVTDAMRWRPTERPAMQKQHNLTPVAGTTWGHLFGQIFIGMIEILIPLAFIVGMIYWRAPWLFWAVVHFLRGEPVVHF